MNQKLCSLKSYLIYNFYIIIRKWEYSSITLLFIQSFKKHFNCLNWHCVLQILHFVEIYDFEWWISWKNLNYLEEIANLRLRSFMDRLFCNLWQKFKLQINFDLVTSMKRKIISTRLWWINIFIINVWTFWYILQKNLLSAVNLFQFQGWFSTSKFNT